MKKYFRVVNPTISIWINFQDYRCRFSIEKASITSKNNFKSDTRKT